MKVARKHYTEHQKRRFVSAIKQRLKSRSLQAALRLVADLEGLSVKSLEHLWYQNKKAERVQAERSGAEKLAAGLGRVYPPAGTPKNEPCTMDPPELVGDRPASPGPAVAPAPPPPKPEPARLLTSGELHCSRCSGKQITYQADTKDYFCSLCGRLEFSGFYDEGPMKPYIADPRYEWMR